MSSFRVQVGPTQISVHQGRTVLVCEPGGMIPAHSEKGLHFNDTRIISSWSLFAGGQNWDLLSGGVISHDVLQTHLTNRKLDTASGPVAARTLWLVLGRSIHGGMDIALCIPAGAGPREAAAMPLRSSPNPSNADFGLNAGTEAGP